MRDVRQIINKAILGGTLFALDKVLNALAAVAPGFKEELKKKNVTVQMKLRDNSHGQWLEFRNGVVTGASVTSSFSSMAWSSFSFSDIQSHPSFL